MVTILTRENSVMDPTKEITIAEESHGRLLGVVPWRVPQGGYWGYDPSFTSLFILFLLYLQLRALLLKAGDGVSSGSHHLGIC